MFTNQSVRLISVTQPIPDTLPTELNTPEGLISYSARVSSSNQDNPDYLKLFRYCIENGHWSIFEQVDMAVEIVTTRAISAQILRHRSFVFQEFSQRYAESTEFILSSARRQDNKNRQNSIDDLDDNNKEHWLDSQRYICIAAFDHYGYALEQGIAKEVARMILPMCTATKLYMKGNVRSWIHYLQSRTHVSTQLEHREIALMVRDIFKQVFPITSQVLEF